MQKNRLEIIAKYYSRRVSENLAERTVTYLTHCGQLQLQRILKVRNSTVSYKCNLELKFQVPDIMKITKV